MNKTRTKVEPSWSETYTYVKSSPSIPNGATVTHQQDAYASLVEDIQYGTGFGKWNECFHYKKTAFIYRPSYLYSVPSSGGNYYVYSGSTPSHSWNQACGSAGWGTAGSIESSLPPVKYYLEGSRLSPPNIPDLDRLQHDALASMLPGFKPDLSLINDIIELKDFKSLPKTLKSVKTILQSFDGASVPLKKLLGSYADVHLQYAFNVSPTVNDVLSIWKALRSTRAQIERLYRDERKYLTAHTKVPLYYVFPNLKDAHQFSGLYDGILLQLEAETTTAVLVVSVDYAYDLQGIPKWLATMQALEDRLGLSLNPAIIWNAIPWSFVVDWVLGVSKFLNQFRYRNFDPKVLIYRVGSSIKVERTVTAILQNSVGGPVCPTVPVSRVTESAYFRQVLDARTFFSIQSLQSSGLNFSEFTLASSLGITKIVKRRR